MKRYLNRKLSIQRLLGYLNYALCLAATIALLLGARQAYLQDQEMRQLRHIARSLNTGNEIGDLRAVVNFVYENAYLGDGKYGPLRASATQVLDPTVGGQCGEFVRLTVNLLNVMGYTAHRLYMFPVAANGQAFDPVTQPSFHVIAEVWVNDHWVIVDPLHGLVFHDELGNLATLEQVVNDPLVIKDGYRQRPLETHPATYGALVSGPYTITSKTFSNAQGLNWGQRPFSWFHNAAQSYGVAGLNHIYLPVLAEEPYAMTTVFWLVCSGLLALSGVTCYVLSSRLASRQGVTAQIPDSSSPSLQTA